ncbi:MAG: DNA translocase FtsK [Clostridia bacterium]|nr:DNA translocase FtsK [Clostridia bacterium]
MCKSVALSNVILAIAFISDIMLLFGISLVKVLMGMEKPAKKVSEITEDAIERSKNDIARRLQEKEQLKLVRKDSKNKNVDPARIINDFCDDEKIVPAKKEKVSNEEKSVPEEPSIFAISELIQKPQKTETVSEDFDEVILSEEISEPEAKKEKLEPLSAKEEQELKESLDNAVAQTHTIQYVLPPLDCLNRPKIGGSTYNEDELKVNGEKLISALNSFNVNASIVGVVPGPSVTRYELAPAPGVKISKFVGLADDLALHMAAPAGLRIEAPIPNKAAIGIEIPNRNKTTVTFRETIDNDKFKNAGSKLTVALGKDIAGTPMFSNLSKMPHLLVAGTTGSGKSVCLNSMIVSLLYNATPDEVKLLLIDPKQVEFGIYNGLPHLLVPVVSDPRKAAGALGWAVTEMLSRYKTLNANGVRDIAAYNSLCDEREDLVKLPHIVIFIDELADLMTVAPSEVEDSIQRLAQMARAAGMHLVVATQRPSVDVITGVIKSNIPSRIALTVKSYVDSKIIIDTGGAEKLMGNGDMLYYPVGVPKPVRIQGCYLSDAEIENVVLFIKANTSSNYDDAVQQEIDRQAVAEKKKTEEASSSGLDSNDDLLMRAVELFVSAPEKASISALQRHLGLGFAKAGRLMDTLEQKGIVGPHMGSKPRNVLVTKAQWYEMNALSQDIPDSAELPSDDTETDGENY